MKQVIGFCEFTDQFNAVRPDNFTYEGLKALYDYLEDYEESTGEEIELDVIAICCEYTEYEDLEEFHGNYNEEEYKTIEDIENATTVIKVGQAGNDGFIIQDF